MMRMQMHTRPGMIASPKALGWKCPWRFLMTEKKAECWEHREQGEERDKVLLDTGRDQPQADVKEFAFYSKCCRKLLESF